MENAVGTVDCVQNMNTLFAPIYGLFPGIVFQRSGLGHFLWLSALGAGLGFLLAMVVFSGLQGKIQEKYVPKAFRGLPIALLSASIVSLALFAF